MSQGKRKSASKPQGPKKREPLATTFQCLFCNHENSVSVKLDKKGGTGDLSCKVCGQTFQTGINYLSAAVDVYSDWVDACDAVAKEAKHDLAGLGGARAGEEYGGTDLVARRQPGGAGRGGGNADEEDDDDGFIEHDEVDAEAEYAG